MQYHWYKSIGWKDVGYSVAGAKCQSSCIFTPHPTPTTGDIPPKITNIPQVRGTQASMKITATDKFTISCGGVPKGLKPKGLEQLDQLESFLNH